MRHRASSPLIDLWQTLPCAAGRLLGQVAGRGPARALVAVIVLLSLGTGAYVVIASVTTGFTNRPAEPADLGQRSDLTASRDGERPNLASEVPTSEARTSNGSSSGPGTPADGQSEASSPATGVAPTGRSRPDQVTGSPDTSAVTPSASPSQPSTASARPSQPSTTSPTTPGDRTPPNTSLSEEFPAGDAARFSFSANEPASFSCSLDGAAYVACDSPTTYSDLDPGWHTFAVRASDAAGNVDPSPAEVRWHAREGRSPDR